MIRIDRQRLPGVRLCGLKLGVRVEKQERSHGKPSLRVGIGRVESYCAVEKPQREITFAAIIGFHGRTVMRFSAQDRLVGVGVVRALTRHNGALLRSKPEAQSRHHCFGQAAFGSRQIAQWLIESAVRPQHGSVAAGDQLHGRKQMLAFLPHGPSQHCIYCQPPPDLARILRIAEPLRHLGRNHAQTLDSRQPGGQLFGNPVGQKGIRGRAGCPEREHCE